MYERPNIHDLKGIFLDLIFAKLVTSLECLLHLLIYKVSRIFLEA